MDVDPEGHAPQCAATAPAHPVLSPAVRVRTLLPMLAAAAAIALGACGEDVKAKNDYISAVNRAQTSFQSRFERLQSKITAVSTPRQDDATLRQFGSAVDAVTAELKRIKPPGEVAELHRRFVTEVESYGTVAAQARKDFKSDDPRKVIAANRRFSGAVTKTASQITATVNEINRKLQE